VRTLDLDKCTDPLLLARMITAMCLPAAYEWLYGEPTPPPAAVTFGQLMAGFLAIAKLPPPDPPKVERVKVERSTATATRLDLGPVQFSSAKEYVEAIIVAARNACNLETEMKAAGCTLVSTDKDGTRHYSSVRGETHDHPVTYAVSDSTDGKGGQRGYSAGVWPSPGRPASGRAATDAA
jgi:hypothetical protein